jgi:5-methylcytosine-specific restriction protein A
MKPQLASQPALIERGTDEQGHSPTAEPLRHLYGTARWKRLRIRVFVRDHFTCQWPGCGRLEGNTSLLVADHKKAHRGDEALFWDETNIQTLCKPHHDSAKQAAERRGRGP